ncbi:uncharacterized protein LOC121318021 [Polyodon spathula]|uniref:uncharacterized protein LOC121318021 n=1 Tax=Polyodon spathula TaxID=7913 RepID=UPI001B7DA9B1|nr:uncharacterized protein LOC121318021 [Polyodon spathula]
MKVSVPAKAESTLIWKRTHQPSLQQFKKTMSFGDCMPCEEEIRAALLPALQDGLESIISLARTVAKINGETINHSENPMLQILIETAYNKTCSVERYALEQVDIINSKSQSLFAEKSKVMCELKSKESDLEGLQIKLKTLNLELKIHQNNIMKASTQLEQAKAELRKAEELQDLREHQYNVSLATMAIPIIGTIIGGVAAVCYSEAYKDAERKTNTAKCMASLHEGEVSDHKRKLDTCLKEIQQKEQEIANTKNILNKVNKKLKRTRALTKELTTVQKKIQDCTTYLSQLSGKVECMKVITSDLIHLDTLITSLREIFPTYFKMNTFPLLELPNKDESTLIFWVVTGFLCILYILLLLLFTSTH